MTKVTENQEDQSKTLVQGGYTSKDQPDSNDEQEQFIEIESIFGDINEYFSESDGDFDCQEATELIVFTTLIAGSNRYEMLGILEAAKQEVLKTIAQSDYEDSLSGDDTQSCACPDCQARLDAGEVPVYPGAWAKKENQIVN